jgi:hypothetical protein
MFDARGRSLADTFSPSCTVVAAAPPLPGPQLRPRLAHIAHWQSGDIALRWTAAGMLEAEQQFRRVIGYRDLAKLAVAIERDLIAKNDPSPTATLVTV